jgi:ubiquinone/menaquinone biosynthesis C-methylase UbiE
MPVAAHSFDDAAAYELFMGRWSRAAGAFFLDWLAPPSAAHWLDVGCGTGVFTQLVVDRCAPASVVAVDPSAAQIAHAAGTPAGRLAGFQVADAQALPFPDASFDVVASALVINFVPDRPRALAEMHRVARAGALVAGYVWDFESDLSPSWPMRRALREIGAEVGTLPGAADSGLPALRSLFEQTGLEDVATRAIEVTLTFPDFDAFWRSQTPSYSPTTKAIAAMSDSDRARLAHALRAALPLRPDGAIEYSARAHAARGRAAP